MGPPHVLELWLVVRKGMLLMKYIRSTDPIFMSVEHHGDHRTAYKDEINLVILSFWDITGFKIVVSVCDGHYGGMTDETPKFCVDVETVTVFSMELRG